MPLDHIARRYADELFQNSREDINEQYRDVVAKLQSQHAARGSIKSGIYLKEHSGALVNQIRLLGEARSSSLIQAYERAGIPFSAEMAQEIKEEVNNYCQSLQNNAVDSFTKTVKQIFGLQTIPDGIEKASVNGLIHGVDIIIGRLSRNLSIKTHETLLDEARLRKAYAAGLGKQWDVFISHATEDKQDFVTDLASALRQSGLLVWFDKLELTIGDSLRRKIDEGLANSRYGIVVLSRHFFAKEWPQHELDGLMSKEIAGTKVILPVWHNISLEEVRSRSPILASRLAARSSDGIEAVVGQIRAAMGL